MKCLRARLDFLGLGGVLSLLLLPFLGAHFEPPALVGLLFLSQLGRPLSRLGNKLLIGSLDGAEGVLVLLPAIELIPGVADGDTGNEPALIGGKVPVG